MKILSQLSFTLFFSLLFSHFAFSQNTDSAKTKPSLEDEIIGMDSLLFDTAFNKCDLELYKNIMSPDLEFYDDRSGLNTEFAVEIASFKDRCSRPFSVTRKLVSATVHVLGDYGAVQIGVHEFYENDKKVEKAKFITVWERAGKSWIVKRVISFDHAPI